MKIFSTFSLLITVILLLHSHIDCAIDTPIKFLPRLALVSELFKRANFSNGTETQDISDIVEEYAKDEALEASSKDYYACAYNIDVPSGGSVILYNKQGSEFVKIPVGYVKAVAFTPDDLRSIIIMHRRSSDFHTEIQCTLLTDGSRPFSQEATIYDQLSLSRLRDSTKIGLWPNIDTVPIKKMYINHERNLIVDLEDKPISTDIDTLSDKNFMVMVGLVVRPQLAINQWSQLAIKLSYLDSLINSTYNKIVKRKRTD